MSHEYIFLVLVRGGGNTRLTSYPGCVIASHLLSRKGLLDPAILSGLHCGRDAGILGGALVLSYQ